MQRVCQPFKIYQDLSARFVAQQTGFGALIKAGDERDAEGGEEPAALLFPCNNANNMQIAPHLNEYFRRLPPRAQAEAKSAVVQLLPVRKLFGSPEVRTARTAQRPSIPTCLK